MLARRHKWIECAELLHNWVDRRDRDLRERQNPVDDLVGTGTEPEASTSRRRIQVKRSIDTALNMLKVSSTGLSEAYLRPPASSSSSNFPSQTPPASPSRPDYLPSDDGRFSPSPSPIDLATRRPSLPHVFYPPVASSRSSKPATLTKPNQSQPRRPRSAGNGADREEDNYPTYGRGGAGRLGNKYSFMNIFKKASENESGVSSHYSSSSLPIPISPTSSNQSAAANFESGTPPSRSSRLHESSTRARTPSTSQSQVGPLYSKPSSGQDYSPSHPPLPLAVDLHNAFAQQQTTRDRSGSSGSRIDLGVNIDDSVRYGSPGSVSGSPLARFGLLRRGPSGQFRDRSGSGASLGAFSTHRNGGGVFDEDVASLGDAPGSKTKSSKPGILRGHHRSTSFGQTQPNSRALRFDASNENQSKFKDTDRVPESAPPNIADFGPRDEITEEDNEYGKPLQRSESRSAMSSTAEDLSTSPPEFPFSLDNPPISVDDPDSPVTVKLRGEDHRGRGDSVSSNSTADSLFNPAQASPSETTTPVLSAGEFSSFQPAVKSKPQEPSVDQKAERSKLGRRGNNVLDIDISLIESHAEAEALVQRTQQDILDLHPDSLTPAPSSGWTPLSAKLAAYGESLALEKRLRQQKEEKAGDSSPSTFQLDLSPTSKTKSGVNRQCSLEHKSHNRVKTPKRPHTSSGTSSSCDSKFHLVIVLFV